MERAGLFVRIPTTQAAQLDRAATKAGMRKQDFVSSLIAAQLDAGRTRRTATGTNDTPDPPGGLTGNAADAVLTLDEAAALLRVATDDIVERVEAGTLPGRRLGGEGRFSRNALLEWLNGTDRVGRAPGFRKATS